MNQIIKLLWEYSKFLSLTDFIVNKKTIIVKKDNIIIRNIYITIYQYMGKIIKLDIFKWLEPITSFFIYR